MGAGSTGVACVNTGRSFIGIELMGCWYEVAKKRIGEAQSAPQAQKPNATREDAEQLSLESLYEIINADSV